MELRMKKMDFSFYKGKKVLVTGHTGFKGSWLCEWLLALGAEVHGLALPPPTKPSLFNQLRLAKRIKSHTIGDIRDLATVKDIMRRVKPNFVFHLAAQPLDQVDCRLHRSACGNQVIKKNDPVTGTDT